MRTLLSFFFLLISLQLYSQKFYKTTGGELNFSNSNIASTIPKAASKMRFTAFFQYNRFYHMDMSKVIGLFSGYSIRNIGLIYSVGDTTYKKRAYTFGIPLAIKLGELENNKYIFIGAELEFPIHYKQKMIYDNQKNKYTSWFDSRVNYILPSLFAGYSFQSGLNFKFRYYLNDFLNKNFNGTDFNVPTNYKMLNSKILLVSVSYNLRNIRGNSVSKKESNAVYTSL